MRLVQFAKDDDRTLEPLESVDRRAMNGLVRPWLVPRQVQISDSLPFLNLRALFPNGAQYCDVGGIQPLLMNEPLHYLLDHRGEVGGCERLSGASFGTETINRFLRSAQTLRIIPVTENIRPTRAKFLKSLERYSN